MKRIIVFAAALMCLFALCSCGEKKPAIDTNTPSSNDWRNTIEYEGSFFVNKELKMLYALDTGSITLWDNGGNGTPFQTLEYDTSVANAIERIETEDFSGDGNGDIRIIYSESGEGKRYTLFLWDVNTNKFAECRLYNTITDPVLNSEDNTVSGVWDLGIFGKVTRVYAFNETSGLDEVEIILHDAENVANKIAADTVGGTVTLSENYITIDNKKCTLYISSEFGAENAYIVHSPEGEWYIDQYCFGFYRQCLDGGDGTVVLGKYVGKAGTAQHLANAIRGEDAEMVIAEEGFINGIEATRYTMRGESGGRFAIVCDVANTWYFAESGDVFTNVHIATGVAVSDTEYVFEIPTIEDEIPVL
ncbi:MAG: hypothetical protein IKL24_05730 [Clostridia bacterium]|nr:hypothetical protein [Clostridia bacterium]